MKNTRWMSGRAMTVAVVVMLAMFLVTRSDALRLRVFCAPAAHWAAWGVGVPCEAQWDGYMLHCAPMALRVVPACSGADFFAITAGLLAMIWARWWPGWLLLIPVAWSVAVAANTSRIIISWHTGAWVAQHLPESMGPAMHMAMGLVVFVAYLAVLYAVLSLWRWKRKAS